MNDGGDEGELHSVDPNVVGAGTTPGDAAAGPSGSAIGSPQNDGMGRRDDLGGHAPKRRRVTRACDECRKKKIKCDGKQVSPHLKHFFNSVSLVHIVQYIYTV
jgi:hypothetical protein